MKIAMTGGNGFVGRNLIPKLLHEEHEILQITTQPELAKKLYGENTKQVLYKKEENNLEEQLNRFAPEVLIHLASYLTAADDSTSMRKLLDANIYFLCSVLDGVKYSGVKWFINTGTFAEFLKGDGQINPAYLYSATKSASRIFIDYYSEAYKFNYMSISPYTIYGGIDSQKKIIDIIYDSLNSDTPVDLTPGNQVLDFIHLDDVTDFYITCISNLEKIPSKSSFQLGTGEGHTLRELVSIMEKFTNKKANINWGGKCYRPRDVMYAVANISQQHHLFGWKYKIKIEEGIKKYLEAKQT